MELMIFFNKGVLMMNVNVVKLDPSGNITLFVLSPVPVDDRRELNDALLSADPDAEQAGCLSGSGRSVRVEMMGGEFCGNASRSAAAYWAHIHGEEGVFEVTCSGAKAPMEARVKKLGSTPPTYDAEIDLPLPLSITEEAMRVGEKEVSLIHVVLPGIDHYVYFTEELDALAPMDYWLALKNKVSTGPLPDAYGLILVEEKSARMIPAVFVTATGTLYWERSCGSGSAAAAAALGLRHQKSLALILKEPGGPISIKAAMKDGKLTGITIGGPVRIDASYEFAF